MGCDYEHTFDMVAVMERGPATAAEVLELVSRARDVCGRLDPSTVGLAEVPQVFDALTSLDRLAGGAVLRMAARYEESNAWKRNGARSPEDDLARKTGTGTGRARRKLSTSKRLRTQPKTDEAVRRGRVSPDQADEVSEGAGAAPEVEDDLLDTAEKQPLHDLRRRVAEERAKADRDREERARRLHRQRCLRRWDDADGMGNLLLRLPGEQLREVDARLKPLVDRVFADARDAGRMEPPEAYAADVVRDLLLSEPATGDGSGGSGGRQAVRPEKKVIALIDADALNRGWVEDGETCEIAGVGPVAVSAVRRLLSDAFLSVVIRKGVDVLNVTHLGRQVTAQQRSALEARAGGRCERCGSTYRLDIDHNEGWTLTHDTRLDDLSWLCSHCHDLKTRHKLRLAGTIGNRWLVDRDTNEPWRGPTGTGPPDDHRAARRPAPGSDPPDGERPPGSDPPEQGDLFTLAR
jgi:hypothetical protein